MKNKIRLLIAGFLVSASLSACGEDPELTQFRNSIEDFCTEISQIDTSINSIDASSESAVSELLSCLDELEVAFQGFADLDFPDEFDYLEEIADEAGDYMSTAVSGYHEAYGAGAYDQYTAAYASENYSRAYKRVQIIITFLHGETPEDVDLQMEE
ncbi:MAG: hypothetical protein NC121_02420 [Blautia sp.]|nr:hypothetical protein [Blautia sp.]